jgi:group II intron reverse transcriptase/maturase
LLHHVTVDLLRVSYTSLKRQAAPGVDGVTWQQYGEGLEERLADLHDRVHRGAYRAQPSRRTYIDKADGRKRPLGIAALEDKVVQQAVGTVLSQIYEEDFLGFSYGFRPGRSQHNALDALSVGLTRKKVNWVLDLDVRGFFDNVSHEWLVKFVEHRVADRRMIRLILKWLKAGVSEQGEWTETKVGTPQGAVISPLLANIYLHYVFDLWVNQWRRKEAHGDMIVVRYADDAVLGFERREDAEAFRQQLEERMRKFGLELHPEKTRLIEFGRFAEENRKRRGEGKPETFDFLGFTHICGKNRNSKRFAVKRKTVGKRLRSKLQTVRQELRRRMHERISETGDWLRSVVQGYFNYHAIPGNFKALQTFRREVVRAWLAALRRRSQRDRMTWERFRTIIDRYLPLPRILHPWPDVRFDAKYLR